MCIVTCRTFPSNDLWMASQTLPSWNQIQDMVRDGHTHVPDDNVVTCMDWNYSATGLQGAGAASGPYKAKQKRLVQTRTSGSGDWTRFVFDWEMGGGVARNADLLPAFAAVPLPGSFWASS